MGDERRGTASSFPPKSPLKQGGLQCLRLARVCLGHYTEIGCDLKKGQEENSKISSDTDVSLWGRYPFSPPFSVSNFTGLDPDLLKSTTTPLALVDLCQHLRSGSDLSPPFSFIFLLFLLQVLKKKKKAALPAHSRARVAGVFCLRNNASFSVHCTEFPSCALEYTLKQF